MPTTSPITRWSRRHTLLAGAALLSGSARATDAAWPGGPVVIHTPYGAGGTSHNLSGVVAAQMSISLGNEVSAQTPDAVVEAFDRELNAAIGASVVNHVLLAARVRPEPGTPARLREAMQDEVTLFRVQSRALAARNSALAVIVQAPQFGISGLHLRNDLRREARRHERDLACQQSGRQPDREQIAVVANVDDVAAGDQR